MATEYAQGEKDMRPKSEVVIGGIRTSTLSRVELCEEIIGFPSEAGSMPRLLFDLNGQGLAMSWWNPDYKKALAAADVIHADGQPLVIASRLLTRTPIAERSATTDMFHDVAIAAAREKIGFFLLGGTEPVNAECARIMTLNYPGLDIAGRRNGYFSAEDEDEICEQINASGAGIIWVGLGKPAEQAFCVRNRSKLRARWMITCGGCFNFVTGSYPRAPRWMQQTGFEWVHRMLTRPRQLAWRYLSTSPIAAILLLTRTRDC
jgi:N-acetylglucosaminyldiphosphoundecaprenol N-acetyl-beta-D-mannosaminyltransferase